MQSRALLAPVGVMSVLLLSSVAGAQDVDVQGNLTMHDSADPTVGNILKEGVPFLHNFGTNNTFLGSNAGNFTMAGFYNTASGYAALFSNTTGDWNTASGASALSSNTTGSFNTASGAGALRFNTTGSNNTANGAVALFANTTGNNNTASGLEALFYNTTGSQNTASGVNALLANTTGDDNTASGADALQGNTTGSSNTALGFGADVAFPGNLTNATAIGARAVVNASNKIRLGDTNVTLIEGRGDFHASGPGNGIILKSPDGLTCARLSIDNSGQLVTTPLACP